jgi:lipopolysaccharide cholinephosphotransferase
LSLDIVPLDGVPSKRSARVRQFWKREIATSLTSNYIKDWGELSLKRKIIKLMSTIRFKGYGYCNNYLEKVRAQYPWDSSDFVTEGAHDNVFDKKDFSDTIYMEFEGYQVPLPVGYEHLLQQLYGDYMALPTIQQRMIPEDEVDGWIVEPNIPYKDYYEIMNKRKKSLKKTLGKKSRYHRYCG